MLLSDGNENLGNAMDMAANARALGVEINVLPLIPESSKEEVYLKEISAPESIKAGQSHEISVIIGSSHDTQARLTFLKDGGYAGEDEIKLETGENELIYLNTFAESGLHKYSVLVQAVGDRVLENNRGDIFIQVAGKPSLLYISPERSVSEELGQTPGRIYTDIVLVGGQRLLQVDALDEELKFLNFLELEARVVRPGGEIEDIRLQQRGPGRYESYFRITGARFASDLII